MKKLFFTQSLEGNEMKRLVILMMALFWSAAGFTGGAPLQKLSVLLDWFANPDHAPLIVAKQQGFFKEQGLDVALLGPADPTDPPKLVAAGRADIGITYEPELMEQIDAGLPLVRIGTLIDKPLNALVVLKSSGIQSIADLKGKHIGSSSNGLTSVLLKVMLAKAGLGPQDVILTNVRYSLTQALLSHKVDAVTGMMRNYEVPILEANDQKVLAFFPEENGVPSYSELVFIANTNHIHDARYPRFLAAIKKAVRYLDEHPGAGWKDFVALYPESNNAVNQKAWFATVPYFAADPASFDHQQWQQFARFMQKNGLIKKIQPLSRYAICP
jgi:putative hydroxymethylpyrimidine transport system substrate-binding protein